LEHVISAHYTQGFETGLYWKKDHTPGGPHLMSQCSPGREQPCTICEDNKQEYKDWHEGFKAGRFFQPKRSN